MIVHLIIYAVCRLGRDSAVSAGGGGASGTQDGPQLTYFRLRTCIAVACESGSPPTALARLPIELTVSEFHQCSVDAITLCPLRRLLMYICEREVKYDLLADYKSPKLAY